MDYYYHPLSPNCRKTSAVLRHTGLDADWHVVDLPKGEQMRAEFLTVNPNGKVPALVDGDHKIWESNAIAIHLAERADSELWPGDAGIRCHILKWMFWQQGHLMQATGRVFFERLLKPMLGQGDPDPDRVQRELRRFRQLAAVLEDAVADGGYVVGDRLTLADWAVASDLTFAAQTDLPLADFPAVETWHRRLDDTPAWAETRPQLPT